jgi:osmotically-inducible protein OsmY
VLALGVAGGGLGCGMRMTLPPVVPLDPKAPPPTDDQLTAAVQARIDYDWILRQRFIRIASASGAVLLTGWVETSLERTIAINIAKTTPGVRRVDDDIRVIRDFF